MNTSTTKSLGCGYCRNIPGKNWKSHQIKDASGNLTCRLIIRKDTCNSCGERGHKRFDCPVREYPAKSAPETPMLVPRAPGAPTWADKIKKNIPENIQHIIDADAKMIAEKKEEESRRKRESWEKRKSEREERMKQQAAVREQNHVANMQKKYGKYWYNSVVGGPEDCETAQELCYKDLLEYERDRRSQYLRELEAKAHRNKNKKTVSYSEYMTMKWPDEDFLPENHPIRQNFAIYASWAAQAYYSKYGKMRPDNHFVAYAYGADLSPEVIERERIATEKICQEIGIPVPNGRYGKVIDYDVVEYNR
jgi:hypothetical protein